jgi:hypothetical protein
MPIMVATTMTKRCGYGRQGANRASTVAAAAIVIDQLSREGYEFVTVDELLGLPAYQ